jgi:ABC-type amino acid transport substrate-binding protein
MKNKILNVEEVDDKHQNINKVLDGRLDVCIENRLVELEALKTTNNVDRLKELKPELNKTDIFAWFSRKKVPLQIVEEFDKKLASIKNDGTYKKISDLYIK